MQFVPKTKSTFNFISANWPCDAKRYIIAQIIYKDKKTSGLTIGMMKAGRGREGARIERTSAEHDAVATGAAHRASIRVHATALSRHHSTVRVRIRRITGAHCRRASTRREFVDSRTTTSTGRRRRATTVGYTTIAGTSAIATVVSGRVAILRTGAGCSAGAAASRGASSAAIAATTGTAAAATAAASITDAAA